VDSKGGLYGTTRPVPGQCGTVFRLTPPAGKTEWTKTVLYNFDNGVKGCDPEAGVILDSNGALYGTTKSGNSPLTGGTIFKLAPPAAGKTVWTETVLYGFKYGTDGYGPVSELIFDKNGRSMARRLSEAGIVARYSSCSEQPAQSMPMPALIMRSTRSALHGRARKTLGADRFEMSYAAG
jgi:hypothetical protein